jgi:hypothetical protein
MLKKRRANEMPESIFGKLGYFNGDGAFVPTKMPAADMEASTGENAEEHMTDTAKHLTPAQAALIAGAVQASAVGANNGVAPLGSDGKVPAQYVSVDILADSVLADTYADLLALSAGAAPVKSRVFVEDAGGDPTVAGGWALYFRKAAAGAASDWVKLAEGESLDVDLSGFAKLVDGKVPATNLPEGTNAAKGIIQLATDAEAAAGTVTAKAVNPKQLNTVAVAAAAAQTAADAAKAAADGAAADAALLDAAYCESEQDMASKNLRAGAVVLMRVANT